MKKILLAAWLGACGNVWATATDERLDIPEHDPRPQVAPAIENSNAKFQSTYVWQRHPAFPARYSGPNSLDAAREPRSYTLTATAFLGMRTWQGGELYFNPEMIVSQSLSNLHGLGGLTNGENQKGGVPNPVFYRARLFVRHTWGLGGGTEPLDDAPNQLAGTVDRNRVVLTAGNIALLDVFDNNSYSHDPRTQFLNWTMMTHGAFDYAADVRGYTWGAALEYYRNDWSFRAGRFAQPIESNGQPLDSRIFRHYGDQIEVEHGHEFAGQPGKFRLLVFRNHARMGSFQDALALWQAGGGAGVPAVADVRRENTKAGAGASLEQALSNNVGLFLRASWNDGQTETYAFTEVERSLSGGVSIKGAKWERANDVVGLGLVQNGLSGAHREYLARGGLGAFIGDGVPPAGISYRYAPEQILEAYYSANIAKDLWLSLDYQYIRHPAYNADRGPVPIVGIRLHWEH
ncbi:MAG TPA: carbohydrate porin [Gallionella sp.]|nr:carbohydrate porin [Gallionella sp.]